MLCEKKVPDLCANSKNAQQTLTGIVTNSRAILITQCTKDNVDVVTSSRAILITLCPKDPVDVVTRKIPELS